LREQCDAISRELQQTSDELSRTKESKIKVKSALEALKQSRAQLERQLADLTQKSELDAKTNQETVKNAKSAYAQRLKDAKAEFDRERQRIFGFAADQLRELVKGPGVLDEESYRVIVTRAATEIKRLTEADGAVRRLVGARTRQTTEEAVSLFAAIRQKKGKTDL
jgi:chromosome segregation ATPase